MVDCIGEKSDRESIHLLCGDAELVKYIRLEEIPVTERHLDAWGPRGTLMASRHITEGIRGISEAKKTKLSQFLDQSERCLILGMTFFTNLVK